MGTVVRSSRVVFRLLGHGLVAEAAQSLQHQAPRLMVPYGTAAGGAGLIVLATWLSGGSPSGG